MIDQMKTYEVTVAFPDEQPVKVISRGWNAYTAAEAAVGDVWPRIRPREQRAHVLVQEPDSGFILGLEVEIAPCIVAMKRVDGAGLVARLAVFVEEAPSTKDERALVMRGGSSADKTRG